MWIILSLALLAAKYFNVIDWEWSSVWMLASAPIWLPWVAPFVLALLFGGSSGSRTTQTRRTSRRAPARRRKPPLL